VQLIVDHVEPAQDWALRYSSWWQDPCDHLARESELSTSDCVAYAATDVLGGVWLLLAVVLYFLVSRRW
jgi:hypothetical protein